MLQPAPLQVVEQNLAVDDETNVGALKRPRAEQMLVSERVEHALVLLQQVDDLVGRHAPKRRGGGPPRRRDEQLAVHDVDTVATVVTRRVGELDLPRQRDAIGSQHSLESGLVRALRTRDDAQLRPPCFSHERRHDDRRADAPVEAPLVDAVRDEAYAGHSVAGGRNREESERGARGAMRSYQVARIHPAGIVDRNGDTVAGRSRQLPHPEHRGDRPDELPGSMNPTIPKGLVEQRLHCGG